MIWGISLLWMISLGLLLRPFVAKQTGLETPDALDIFTVRQGILLAWLIFALYPVWFTGLIALMATLPKASLKRSLILVSMSVLALAVSPVCEKLLRSQIHLNSRPQ